MRPFMTLALLLVSVSAVAKDSLQWHTATLLDTAQASKYVGSTDAGLLTHLALTKNYRTYWLEDERYVYGVQERITARQANGPVEFIVNAPVQFSSDSKHLYLIDKNGKQHETTVFKQIAK